jgi:hypothetical protein
VWRRGCIRNINHPAIFKGAVGRNRTDCKPDEAFSGISTAEVHS